MTADYFNARFKRGDVLSIGPYNVIFSDLTPGLLRSHYNAIMYYAIIDPYDTVAVYLTPVRGIGYIEDYRDDEVKLVPNKSKKHFFDEIAKRGYKWDSVNNRIVRL